MSHDQSTMTHIWHIDVFFQSKALAAVRVMSFLTFRSTWQRAVSLLLSHHFVDRCDGFVCPPSCH
jgi:hypothetical protein